MRFPPHIRMSVTRREEKEHRLGAFIARNLAILAPVGRDAEPRQGGGISVIARSLHSPVAKAIAALAPEIAAAGRPVRIILARSDRPLTAVGWPDAVALECEVRLAKDPRLAEAHEQLVLGSATCWTGDSMRRDPAASDAYESYVDDCVEIARAAAMTFERLWTGAQPLFECRLVAPAIGLADGAERRP
jgi:hypothetical protein